VRVDNVADGRFAGYELVVQAMIHYKGGAIFHVYRIPVADPEPIRAARKTKDNMKERSELITGTSAMRVHNPPAAFVFSRGTHLTFSARKRLPCAAARTARNRCKCIVL